MSQQNFDPNQYGQQPAQGMPQPVSGQAPDAQSKATLAHISVFLTWIVTLIMWSIYKDKPGYEVVKRAAARAFNVSITISIATIVGLIIPIILVAVAVAGDNRGLAVVALILLMVPRPVRAPPRAARPRRGPFPRSGASSPILP